MPQNCHEVQLIGDWLGAAGHLGYEAIENAPAGMIGSAVALPQRQGELIVVPGFEGVDTCLD